MAIINGDINDNIIDGTANADTINGFAGNDALVGHLGADTLNGGSNDDDLYGGDGADTLNGGNGADSLEGSAGADTLNGGAGIDVADFNGPAGVHVVIGGISHGGDAEGDFVGNDVEDIWGTETYDDELIGSAADNTLDGFGGNDKLYGLSGDDTLGGRLGDDLLVGGSGADRLFGGAGIDTADYGLSAMAVIVVIGGAGTGGDAQGDLVASDIENIVGSTKDDTLVGSTAANLLKGSFGKDALSGWGGDDTLEGVTATTPWSAGPGRMTWRVATGWIRPTMEPVPPGWTSASPPAPAAAARPRATPWPGSRTSPAATRTTIWPETPRPMSCGGEAATT